MITVERLLECALFPFPLGGQLIQYKNKSILYLLFDNPLAYRWVLDKATNNQPLRNETNLLLEAVSTINPVTKCSEGNPVRYWFVYKQTIVYSRICANENCTCRESPLLNFGTLICHNIKDVLPYLKHPDYAQGYVEQFKRDYALPSEYSDDMYLNWLISNARLEELEDYNLDF